VIFFLVVCLAVGVYLTFRLIQKPPAATPVTASSGRLTLKDDDNGDLAVVDRKKEPELWYRVTLENAPIGSKLALSCDWIDPQGKVVHRNRYETREIDRPVWPTHARYQLTPNAPAGTWTVRLYQADRVLHSKTFEVRD
jgi:hypothetical protein